MTIRYSALILFIFVILGCSSNEGTRGVIFSEQKAQKSGLLGPFWVPTEMDVTRLEEVMSKIFKQSKNAQYQQIGLSLNSYKRQYVGVIRSGKRYIHVNCFCGEIRHQNWQTDYVVVMDGGSCYFNFDYDPASKTITDIFINGEA